jgi:superfamily II DNA/RNA helicase
MQGHWIGRRKVNERGGGDIINTDGEQYEADQWRRWNEDFGFHTRKKKTKKKKKKEKEEEKKKEEEEKEMKKEKGKKEKKKEKKEEKKNKNKRKQCTSILP